FDRGVQFILGGEDQTTNLINFDLRRAANLVVLGDSHRVIFGADSWSERFELLEFGVCFGSIRTLCSSVCGVVRGIKLSKHDELARRGPRSDFSCPIFRVHQILRLHRQEGRSESVRMTASRYICGLVAATQSYFLGLGKSALLKV